MVVSHTRPVQAMFWTTCPIMPFAHKVVENKILPVHQGQIKEHDLGPEEAPHAIEISRSITI